MSTSTPVTSTASAAPQYVPTIDDLEKIYVQERCFTACNVPCSPEQARTEFRAALQTHTADVRTAAHDAAAKIAARPAGNRLLGFADRQSIIVRRLRAAGRPATTAPVQREASS